MPDNHWYRATRAAGIVWTALFASAVMTLVPGCTLPHAAMNRTDLQPFALPAADTGQRVEPAAAGRTQVLGQTRRGRSLTCVWLGDGPDRTLILSGVHGDEPQSTDVVRRLGEFLAARPALLQGRQVVLFAAVNPDGLEKRIRKNAAGVDLNRNFPASNWKPSHPRGRYHGGPSPASEPETQAMMGIVQEFKPHKIIAVHAISGGRECNNFDGPAEDLARQMSGLNGYPVRPTIGYPTPGCLGSWAGAVRGIPTVTLELPASAGGGPCWRANRDALLAAIQFRATPLASSIR